MTSLSAEGIPKEVEIAKKKWADHHVQTSEAENRSKRDNERQSRRSSTSCVREGNNWNLEHRASFLFQRAARKVQPLQPPGGYITKFCTGRLRPEVQPLTLSYTILAEKVPLATPC